MQAPVAADANVPDPGVTWSADDNDDGGIQLLTVPRDQLTTLDLIMKQVDNIESLASDEDDD